MKKTIICLLLTTTALAEDAALRESAAFWEGKTPVFVPAATVVEVISRDGGFVTIKYQGHTGKIAVGKLDLPDTPHGMLAVATRERKSALEKQYPLGYVLFAITPAMEFLHLEPGTVNGAILDWTQAKATPWNGRIKFKSPMLVFTAGIIHAKYGTMGPLMFSLDFDMMKGPGSAHDSTDTNGVSLGHYKVEVLEVRNDTEICVLGAYPLDAEQKALAEKNDREFKARFPPPKIEEVHDRTFLPYDSKPYFFQPTGWAIGARFPGKPTQAEVRKSLPVGDIVVSSATCSTANETFSFSRIFVPFPIPDGKIDKLYQLAKDHVLNTGTPESQSALYSGQLLSEGKVGIFGQTGRRYRFLANSAWLVEKWDVAIGNEMFCFELIHGKETPLTESAKAFVPKGG